MKTINEIKQWLLENATDENGEVDLSYIDFGDRVVSIRGIKARVIDNGSQQAKEINNYGQQAEKIYNLNQEAIKIYNDNQEAIKIYNGYQEADVIYNDFQKAKRIDNSYQTAYEKQVLIPNYNNMSKEELVKVLEKQLLGDE